MKKQITISELKSLIKEEAVGLNRRAILEGEKKKLMEELKMMGEYDDFDSEASSQFYSQLADNLKNFLKGEINLKNQEIDGVVIPEEVTLNDIVSGMMEVLGVVMDGKSYTISEKDVDPGFLDRFR